MLSTKHNRVSSLQVLEHDSHSSEAVTRSSCTSFLSKCIIPAPCLLHRGHGNFVLDTNRLDAQFKLRIQGHQGGYNSWSSLITVSQVRWLERQLSRRLLQEESEEQRLSLILGTDPRHFTIEESEPGRFFFSVARTDNQFSEIEGDLQAISALRNQCQALIALIRFFQQKNKSTTFSAIQLPDSEDTQPITVQILTTSSALREKIYGLLADATMVVVVTFAFSDPAMAHALECVLRRGGLVEVWTGFPIESTYRKQQRLLTRLSVWPTFGWQTTPGIHDKLLITNQGTLFMSANLTAGLYKGSESGVWVRWDLPEVTRIVHSFRTKLHEIVPPL